MPNPLINIGGSIGDGTGEIGPRAWLQKINRLPIIDQTINAACGDYIGTHEQQITAAIADAGARAILANKGNWFVWIPKSWCPYNPSQVSFNNSAVNGVQMIREGGPTNSFDVVAYGAAANGSIDDSAAILAAATAANSRIGGGTVYFSDFGANTYLINSPLTFDAYTDVSFIGQGGPNQSRIIMGVAGAHCMNFTGICSRITIRDLWLGSNSALANGAGLQITGTVGVHSDRFVVEHVTIQNAPSPFRLQYVDSSAFRDVNCYQTIAGATTGAVFSMNSAVSCYFFACYNVVTTGTLPAEVWLVDYDTDTIILVACQALFGGTHGFNFAQSAGSTGPRLTRASDCFSESNGQHGFNVSAARDLRLRGCHAAVNTLSGYAVSGGASVTITDSFSLQNQQHGFGLTGGSGLKIDGCTASNNSQQTNNTYDGIFIAANVTDVRVSNNRSGDFIFSLANKQRYGISLGSGTSDFLIVSGNELETNQTGRLLNSSTGTHNMIWANPGVGSFLSDAAYVSPGIAGAPVAATYRLPAILFRSAGLTTTSTSDASIVAFTLKGTTLGTSAAAVRVQVGGRQATQAGSFNLKFGATVLATIVVASGANFHANITITRSGSSSQASTGLTITGATVTSISTLSSETLASDIIIDFRGSVTSGGTMTLDNAMVEYVNAI